MLKEDILKKATVNFEPKALDMIRDANPEVKDYPNNSAMREYKSRYNDDNLWQFVFFQGAADVNFVSAKCYSIDSTKKITKTGEYENTMNQYTEKQVSFSNCKPND